VFFTFIIQTNKLLPQSDGELDDKPEKTSFLKGMKKPEQPVPASITWGHRFISGILYN
jgi:hypothetical protein